jgi:hypothetical protein
LQDGAITMEAGGNLEGLFSMWGAGVNTVKAIIPSGFM